MNQLTKASPHSLEQQRVQQRLHLTGGRGVASRPLSALGKGPTLPTVNRLKPGPIVFHRGGGSTCPYWSARPTVFTHMYSWKEVEQMWLSSPLTKFL